MMDTEHFSAGLLSWTSPASTASVPATHLFCIQVDFKEQSEHLN